VKFPRRSGVLLHISSLPSRFGIGDLGQAAFRFADFLVEAGQKLWQVLPVGPTGYGDSPYQCFSAFAGNPLFIDLEALQEQGLIEPNSLERTPSFSPDAVQYEQVIDFKSARLRKAAQVFFRDKSNPQRAEFESFCLNNASWLEDYALFMACKDAHGGVAWTKWDEGIRKRDPNALKKWRNDLAHEIETFKYFQFEFDREWEKLASYCHDRGLKIIGDIPIYVAHDSADVWAHPDLFHLDDRGMPTIVAGVPPDYFSSTGQLWGNPIYGWDVLESSGYAWWVDRFRASLKLFDIVRLDHFRGFEAYWEIPGDATMAAGGKWTKGPGAKLFQALENQLGELPIIAENLGVITDEVENIRKQFGYPGMSLLQFAFGTDPQGPSFRPHNYERELVAYTGGHDNDTTVGWWGEATAADSTRTNSEVKEERAFTKAYLNLREDEPINWAFIRTVLASVADTAIVPLQDILGLGKEARMNLPGTISGNWKWRYQSDALTQGITERLKVLSALYDR
jgi:4-alpha-glucanotransferase